MLPLRLRRFVQPILAALATLTAVHAQTPEWIWHPLTNGAQVVHFRRTFRTPPLLWNARLTVSADDEAEVFLNGVSVATCKQWNQPLRAEVSVRLNQGENVIAVRAHNRAGAAGVLVNLNLLGQTNLVSDASWLASTNQESGWTALGFNAAHWQPARSRGAVGIAPWGDVLQRAWATPAESLTVAPGFKVELLRSAEPGQGSWIRMAFDPRGDLFISPQGDDLPLLRFFFVEGAPAKVEPVSAPIRYAMGLLFAHGSLYANARGPEGAGLHRLTDANGNGQFDADEVRLLKKFEGAGEHGYHDVALGPDGKIYVLNGNGTKLPHGLAPQSPHRNYAEDMLTADTGAGADRTSAPAGHVLRTDPDGREWELFLGGLRNSYGFDFNTDGELFVFDSDMEWDWGAPWYRPTRIVHGVSGGEYGWRDGVRLWPDDYADSLPGVVNVGIGSPTAAKFGTRSRFPEKYRRALFGLDWSYGRIFAVHLQPDGSSYRGEVETFLRGTPLNLTDLAFGPDGAMYFITGGRGTQSGLYRVRYIGDADAPVAGSDPAGLRNKNDSAREARSLRHQLERFHGLSDVTAVEVVWPHLGSDDRFLRHAARIALESQELPRWRDRALAETNASTALTALLALARLGGNEMQAGLLKALERFPLASLDDELKLRKLRILQLSLLRQRRPDANQMAPVIQDLSQQFPEKTWPLNRELARTLLWLEAPDSVPRTLNLLAAAPTLEEQLHYVAQMRHVRSGWSLADRQRYFEWWLKPRDQVQRPAELLQWFDDAGRTYVDGAFLNRYLREFRTEAIASLTAAERAELGPLLARPFQKSIQVPTVSRPFVRDWKLADLLPDLDRLGSGRSFERGQRAFAEAQCLACHRFGNDGGATGPELTAAGSKYDARSLLESLLEPSKVINEQYRHTMVILKNGDSVTGRLTGETDAEVLVEVDPASAAHEKIARRDIQEVKPSSQSPMPEGLVNTLSRDEILDLIAYLQAAGRSDAAAFAKRP